MFSFFKKSDPYTKVDDVIWMNEQKKLEALGIIAKETPDTIFLAWFDETYDKLSEHLSQNGLPANSVYSAQKTWQREIQDKPIIFIEHYPLRDKEEEVYEKLGLQNAIVHTALDEPFMKAFGSEKIIDLMKKMGVKEDECLQHAMISSSIKNAQEKLKQKIAFEHTCRSQADWIRHNVSS